VTAAADPSSRWTIQGRGTAATAIHGLPPTLYHVVVTFATGRSSVLFAGTCFRKWSVPLLTT